MVLVSVCENDASELFLIASDICEIRYYAVDARHVLVGEAHSHINDDHVVAVFESGHVLADLAEAAKRDNFQF